MLFQQSAPSRPLARPKRRRHLAEEATGSEFTNPVLAELERVIEEATQMPPPLKKFKALFEETDPDRVETQSGAISYSGAEDLDDYNDDFGSTNQTQTQTQSGAEASKKRAQRLQAVPEEAEESQSQAEPLADVQMGTNVEPPRVEQDQPTASGSNQLHSTARRANSSTGAAPGKPDTDNAFLKALASTKKGKRAEDDFDREFNNLRISKPEIAKDAAAKQWEVLEDFGDDGDLRGNFMMIVEMDVPTKENSNGARSTVREMRTSWQGKPDFKKFKKA